MGQFKARYRDTRTFLALRPSYFFFGRLISKTKPSIYVPGIGYIVNDPQLARTVMKDQDHFSINEGGGLGKLVSEAWGDIPTILSMDGEEHKRVKFTLLESFKEEALSKSLERELSQLTSNLTRKLNKGEQIDIAEYTRLYTLKIVSKLLGNEKVSNKQLLHISDLATSTMDCIKLTNKTFSKSSKRKMDSYVKEFKKIAKLYYETGIKDKNSLIYMLHQLGYSREKTYGFISMFLVAGTVTVSSSFPRILAVLIDTDLIKRLRENKELVDTAIPEGLRYITPGTTALYGVKSDIEIEGIKYVKGRRVIISLYNILHDKTYTKSPFIYDIKREQNANINGLWFGTGAHFCMGSVLAQLEIRLLLNSVAKLPGNLVIKKRKYRKQGVYPSYETLMVALD